MITTWSCNDMSQDSQLVFTIFWRTWISNAKADLPLPHKPSLQFQCKFPQHPVTRRPTQDRWLTNAATHRPFVALTGRKVTWPCSKQSSQVKTQRNQYDCDFYSILGFFPPILNSHFSTQKTNYVGFVYYILHCQCIRQPPCRVE